jgi:hypothetical protein
VLVAWLAGASWAGLAIFAPMASFAADLGLVDAKELLQCVVVVFSTHSPPRFDIFLVVRQEGDAIIGLRWAHVLKNLNQPGFPHLVPPEKFFLWRQKRVQ